MADISCRRMQLNGAIYGFLWEMIHSLYGTGPLLFGRWNNTNELTKGIIRRGLSHPLICLLPSPFLLPSPLSSLLPPPPHFLSSYSPPPHSSCVISFFLPPSPHFLSSSLNSSLPISPSATSAHLLLLLFSPHTLLPSSYFSLLLIVPPKIVLLLLPSLFPSLLFLLPSSFSSPCPFLLPSSWLLTV